MLEFVMFVIKNSWSCTLRGLPPVGLEAVAQAMGEDDLHMHHEYFYASIALASEPNSFQQVLTFFNSCFFHHCFHHVTCATLISLFADSIIYRVRVHILSQQPS